MRATIGDEIADNTLNSKFLGLVVLFANEQVYPPVSEAAFCWGHRLVSCFPMLRLMMLPNGDSCRMSTGHETLRPGTQSEGLPLLRTP